MAKNRKRPGFTATAASPEQLQARLGRSRSGAAGVHGWKSNRTQRRNDKQALRAGRWEA